MEYKLADLAVECGAKVQGNAGTLIKGAATLESAGSSDITFLADKKYRQYLSTTQAGAVILSAADAQDFSGNAIICEKPHVCFAQIASLLHHDSQIPGIHASAVIAEDVVVPTSASIGPHVSIGPGAQIGENVIIDAGSVLEQNVRLGEGTRLYANVVVLRDCVIGRQCILHPGAIIGSDGFGYAKEDINWIKVPQLGRVVIGDNVEIGANTTIDRGALDDTVIGHGVKLDNLIQIAHNVKIGDNTIIAACVGIAGSAVIGQRCAIGGQAGILGHLEITDDVQIAAKSFVTNSIKRPGVYASSIKVSELHQWQKNVARLQHLDEMARRLKQLEQQVKRLDGER